MSSIKGRLEKLEAAHSASRPPAYNVVLMPGESKDQAMARWHAQHPPGAPPFDPAREILFITWLA